jgi:hypothetical protein
MNLTQKRKTLKQNKIKNVKNLTLFHDKSSTETRNRRKNINIINATYDKLIVNIKLNGEN